MAKNGGGIPFPTGPAFLKKLWQNSEEILIPAEKPEGVTKLQQRLDGQQVARLDYVLSPALEWGLALAFTGTARFIVWATKDDFGEKYKYRLMLRWMMPQKILTGRGLYSRFNRDRHAVVDMHGRPAAEEPHDALQQAVEGEVIIGAEPTYEPNRQGGETLVIQFRGGGALTIQALPPRPSERKKGYLSDLAADWTELDRTTINTPLIVSP